MSKREVFTDAEIANPADITAIGLDAQEAFDAIHGGALGWPAHWARITVSQATSDSVAVSPGEYHNGEAVYAADDAITVNLQSYKPVVSTDERWLALILRGSEETINATRAFETGEEPLTASVPVNQSTPKTIARVMSVVVQQGVIAPPPALLPTVNENDCCIAFARITSTGIQEIVASDPHRVKTVFEIEGRVTAIEIQIGSINEATVSLQTDMANLGARVDEVPDNRLFRQITRDVSIARQLLNFPAEARNYYFDQGLLNEFWDFSYAGSDFRINEGIRFPYQIQRETQIRLLNTAQSDIMVWDGTLVLPKYTERVRIENPLGKVRKDISNVVHTVTSATVHTASHTRIRYGETINVCENQAGWGDVADKKAQQIFAVNGQTFISKGLSDDPWNDNPASGGGHKNFSVQKVIKDTYRTSYTTYNTETFGLSGAVYGQTFVCAQVMVATSIDLYFTRVGSVGDVLLCLCEITASGQPDYSSVIMSVNKPQADLVANAWNNFRFKPTILDQGKRYGWFTVTTGNHQLAATGDNAFGGGTMFLSTDGIWAQGDVKEDFCFRVNAAKFEASRTVVPMENLQLTGGMSEVEMVYQGWEPDFTRLVLELKPEGANDWVPMDGRDDNALKNLPANVQLRAVFVGTEDVAPCIILDTNAVSITGRMKFNQKAISKELVFGFTTTTLQIVLNADAFKTVNHDFVPKLIVAGVEVAASAITEVIDPAKPSRTTFVADFTLGAAAGSARLLINGNTNSVTDVPFIQDVQLNAW